MAGGTVLVIARREGEGVYVGNGIRIVVVGVSAGGAVRLGFDVPEDVAVTRDGAFTEAEHGAWQRERETRAVRRTGA